MNYEKQYQKYKKKYLNLKYNKTGGTDQNIKYIGEFKETLCKVDEENKNCYKFKGVALDENNKKIGNPNMEGFWKTEYKYSTGKKKMSFINNDGNTINYSWKSDQEWHIPTPEELNNIKNYIPKDNQKIIYGIFNGEPKYKQDEEADGSYNEKELYNLIIYLNDCIKYFISDNYAFMVLKELKQEDYFNNLSISTSEKIKLSTDPFKPSPYSESYKILFKNSEIFNNIIKNTNTTFLYIITELYIINNTYKIKMKNELSDITNKIRNILDILECKINYNIEYIENIIL